MTSSVVTTRVEAATLAGLQKLAEHHDRSRAWLVADAIRRYVSDELELIAFLQEGEDDFARGDYVTHEEFIAELKLRRGHRDAA